MAKSQKNIRKPSMTETYLSAVLTFLKICLIDINKNTKQIPIIDKKNAFKVLLFFV